MVDELAPFSKPGEIGLILQLIEVSVSSGQEYSPFRRSTYLKMMQRVILENIVVFEFKNQITGNTRIFVSIVLKYYWPQAYIHET